MELVEHVAKPPMSLRSCRMRFFNIGEDHTALVNEDCEIIEEYRDLLRQRREHHHMEVHVDLWMQVGTWTPWLRLCSGITTEREEQR